MQLTLTKEQEAVLNELNDAVMGLKVVEVFENDRSVQGQKILASVNDELDNVGLPTLKKLDDILYDMPVNLYEDSQDCEYDMEECEKCLIEFKYVWSNYYDLLMRNYEKLGNYEVHYYVVGLNCCELIKDKITSLPAAIATLNDAYNFFQVEKTNHIIEIIRVIDGDGYGLFSVHTKNTQMK